VASFLSIVKSQSIKAVYSRDGSKKEARAGPVCELRRLCNAFIPTLVVAQLTKNFRAFIKKNNIPSQCSQQLAVGLCPEPCNSIHIL
jgi:hypothetical protein